MKLWREGRFAATSPAASVRRRPLAAVAIAGGLLLVGCGSDAPANLQLSAVSAEDSATFEYLIPLGSGERLDAGEPLEIFPAELTARVGDTIRIINNDDRGHTVGPFFVGANETLSQQFASEGVFEGVCTVHPSGQVVLTVRA